MNKNEYSQYAFKKITNQDTYVSSYVAQKKFRIEGTSLAQSGIYVWPWGPLEDPEG